MRTMLLLLPLVLPMSCGAQVVSRNRPTDFAAVGGVVTLSLQRQSPGPGERGVARWGAKPERGCEIADPNRNPQQFILGTLVFDDAGRLTNDQSLLDVTNCITKSRSQDLHGVIVVVYVHGWRHDAHWDFAADTGDLNVASFRSVLTGLTLREAERYSSGVAGGRTVVGVYVGWTGGVGGGLTSFPGRYAAAQRIGRGADLRRTLGAIQRATKEPSANTAPGVDSPLILAGHSMGGRILQAAVTESLKNTGRDLLWPMLSATDRCVQVLSADRRVAFPDLILLLNPATTSGMATELRRALDRENVRKQVSCDVAATFVGPVVISVTSEDDWVTKWPMVVSTGSKAEGHDDGVLTHQLHADRGLVRCPPRVNDHIARDFEQAWHCLRMPIITSGVLRGAVVDLPQVRDPRSECHVRFRAMPYRSRDQRAYWIVRVPKEVVADHGDIFNARMNSLAMSFAQISGSLLSLASDWQNTFEPESGICP